MRRFFSVEYSVLSTTKVPYLRHFIESSQIKADRPLAMILMLV